MSINPNSQRRGPPLAGRPPFATDEDEAVYENAPARPRQQQQKPPQQGAGRDSMYQAWDNYLHTDGKERPNSGAGGIGMGLMAGELDDSDDEDQPRANTAPLKTSNAPLKSSNLRPAEAQPRPSTDSQRNNGIARPAPAMVGAPAGRQGTYDRAQQQQHQQQYQQQNPPISRGPGTTGVQRPAAAALRVDVPQPAMPIPRAPIPAFMQSSPVGGPSPSPSPSFIPHPLNAPSTPITPVFARPSFQEPSRKVEFKEGPIMRGNSEETLLPRNTQKGEEFWRRFSFIAKEEPKRKKSKWLRSTVRTNATMSRFVWCISIFLLLCIGGAIGFGWYMTHNDKAPAPMVVGDRANETMLTSTGARSTAAAAAASTNTSRTLIAPTAIETKKRDLPTPTASPTATPTAFARRAHELAARNRLNRLD